MPWHAKLLTMSCAVAIIKKNTLPILLDPSEKNQVSTDVVLNVVTSTHVALQFSPVMSKRSDPHTTSSPSYLLSRSPSFAENPFWGNEISNRPARTGVLWARERG